MAIQGPVIQWVADHRRHHAFADRAGDPHSPWRYGTDLRSLLKGMFHAHLGWLFDRRKTNQERYAPDLLKDGGLVVISRTVRRLGLPRAWRCPPSSAAWSPAAGPAPGRRSSGPVWSASPCCTT